MVGHCACRNVWADSVKSRRRREKKDLSQLGGSFFFLSNMVVVGTPSEPAERFRRTLFRKGEVDFFFFFLPIYLFGLSLSVGKVFGVELVVFRFMPREATRDFLLHTHTTPPLHPRAPCTMARGWSAGFLTSFKFLSLLKRTAKGCLTN